MFGFKKKNKNVVQNYMVSELGQIRYELEHRLFRDNFFNEPTHIINAILSEDGVYNIFNNVLSKSKIGNPYGKKDFKADFLTFDDNNLLISVELPIPEYVPLCYRVHFIVDSVRNVLAYYTIEKGNTGGFLCRWFGDKHISIHEIVNPIWEEKEKAFMKALEANIILKDYNSSYQNNS